MNKIRRIIKANICVIPRVGILENRNQKPVARMNTGNSSGKEESTCLDTEAEGHF